MMCNEDWIKKLQEQLDRDNVNEIEFIKKESKEEGARETLEATIKAMFNDGLESERIAKIVNLPTSEVERIINS